MGYLSKINKQTGSISAQGINKTKKSYKVKKTAQARFSLKLISAEDPIFQHMIYFFFKINK